ncbi:MAG TPA: hypothetical protein VIE66_03385 [Methylocella sp.]|jgi:hypothetical protein
MDMTEGKTRGANGRYQNGATNPSGFIRGSKAAKDRVKSRLVKGRLFDPEKVDCRTFAARRFRDVLAQVTATIPDSASLEAKMLCRSIAQLKITLEDMETASARGEKIDRAGYSVMAGHGQVARLFRQLKANVAGVKFVDDDDDAIPSNDGQNLDAHIREASP